MLGGYSGFSYETIYFVYYKVNGMEEEAQACYEKIQEENKKIEEASRKLKTEAEINSLALLGGRGS
jgi:cell division protein FtsB